MRAITKIIPGIILTIIRALFASYISVFIPKQLISAGVFSLLIGMILNPIVRKYEIFNKGIRFTSKTILKLAIVLMGATLSFTQVLNVGKYSLFVMMFTLVAAFGEGYLLSKSFKMNWKLSSLISAGTEICGGTAINDTSSVVAAGYTFSDAAGNFSLIVKLTGKLSIIPVVLIFSYINQRVESKNNGNKNKKVQLVNIKKIFPYFIILFLVMVGFRSSGFINYPLRFRLSSFSKFSMIMALGAIGLNTNFKEVSKSGFLAMVHGFIILLLVVVVSFVV